MEEMGKANLLSGIKDNADKEAQAIIKASEEHIAQKMSIAQKQIETIRTDGEKYALNSVDQLKKMAFSAQQMEERRADLESKEELTNKAVTLMRQKLETMISEPSYKKILMNWIVEATLGLNEDSLEVNAGRDEINLIDKSLLDEAAAEVSGLSGRKVAYQKKENHPLSGQGVSLAAPDGKTIFNNSVSTRFIRYQTEIRRTIQSILFERGNA